MGGVPLTRRKRTEEEKILRREAYKSRDLEQIEKDRLINKKSYDRNVENKRKASSRYREVNTVDGVTPEKQYCIDHPEKYLFWAARNRAKRDGLELTITEEDIVIPTHCPILGLELISVRQTRQNRDRVPSLDRLDNTKGYIKDNVRVISFKANRYKTDMSVGDLENLLLYSRGYL